jgi:hypothetical protein
VDPLTHIFGFSAIAAITVDEVWGEVLIWILLLWWEKQRGGGEDEGEECDASHF